MAYEPNKWFIDPMNRTVAEACRVFEDDFILLLRPSRRALFFGPFLPREHTPDFNKPCMGVLAYKSDVDKKPQLVIETEEITDTMRQVYIENEILWCEVYPHAGGLMLTAEHGGVQMKISAPAHKLSKMLSAPLCWAREKIAQPQGKLIQSYHERLMREAIETLYSGFRVKCHHQVPFGYVTGYRVEMPKPIARTTMDIVLTLDYEADPDGAVILPIKIDLHSSHFTDPAKVEKDKLIECFAEEIGMPLLKITCGEDDDYLLTCSALNLPPTSVASRNKEEWADAMTPLIREAIKYAGRSA